MDRDGFDRRGFDHQGFDRHGFDRRGFDRRGFDRRGFDRRGFDRRGIDRWGRDHRDREIDRQWEEFYDREQHERERYRDRGEGDRYGRRRSPSPLRRGHERSSSRRLVREVMREYIPENPGYPAASGRYSYGYGHGYERDPRPREDYRGRSDRREYRLRSMSPRRDHSPPRWGRHHRRAYSPPRHQARPDDIPPRAIGPPPSHDRARDRARSPDRGDEGRNLRGRLRSRSPDPRSRPERERSPISRSAADELEAWCARHRRENGHSFQWHNKDHVKACAQQHGVQPLNQLESRIDACLSELPAEGERNPSELRTYSYWFRVRRLIREVKTESRPPPAQTEVSPRGSSFPASDTQRRNSPLGKSSEIRSSSPSKPPQVTTTTPPPGAAVPGGRSKANSPVRSPTKAGSHESPRKATPS